MECEMIKFFINVEVGQIESYLDTKIISYLSKSWKQTCCSTFLIKTTCKNWKKVWFKVFLPCLLYYAGSCEYDVNPPDGGSQTQDLF